jgi:hypothetical protein
VFPSGNVPLVTKTSRLVKAKVCVCVCVCVCVHVAVGSHSCGSLGVIASKVTIYLMSWLPDPHILPNDSHHYKVAMSLSYILYSEGQHPFPQY